jgi:hypothetical protein
MWYDRHNGALSSPCGMGSLPKRSAILTLVGSKLCKAESTSGFFMKVPDQEEPVSAEHKPEAKDLRLKCP